MSDSGLTHRLARFAATVLENPWIPESHRKPVPPSFRVAPTLPQAQFLMLECEEAMYGGQARGGKSDALLMAALQYATVPGYSAILFRRTFEDLKLPDALIPRAKEWLLGRSVKGMQAKWNGTEHLFTIPTSLDDSTAPATLAFGYLKDPDDHLRYQGAAFQFIGFDELTQLREHQYTYLFSRLCRLEGSDVPLRVRSATNPGGPGHGWVKQRFITGGEPSAVFVPARLEDNPHVDQVAYRRACSKLLPIEQRRLLHGDWDAGNAGGTFQRDWFVGGGDFERILDAVPEPAARMRVVRFWDMAGTPKKGRSGRKEPCYTAGVKLGIHDGIWYVLDMRRIQGGPEQVEALIKSTAIEDGRMVPIKIEQEPGSASIHLEYQYQRHALVGYALEMVRPHGNKEARAGPVATAAHGNCVRLIRGPWVSAFLDEFEAFPNGFKDQVDAVSGAMEALSSATPIRTVPNRWVGARG